MKLNYIRLLTTKFTEMLEFYRDLLELEVRHLNETGQYVEFQTDRTRIAVFNRDLMMSTLEIDDTISPVGDRNLLVFMVDDISKMYTKIKDTDIKLVSKAKERHDWGTKGFHFRDPEGNLIEIYQPIEESN